MRGFFHEEKESFLTSVIPQVPLDQDNQHDMLPYFGVTCSEYLHHLILYFRQVNTHHHAKFSIFLQGNMYIIINLYCFLKILQLSMFLQTPCKYT